MIKQSDITGLILAGGLGRRMSEDGKGTNKALTGFNGRPMIAHIIERLSPQVGGLIINANQDVDRFEAFGLPVTGDKIDGYAGPLAGLHSGLSAAPTSWLMTCPCDSPFIPSDLVQKLSDAADQGNHDLAVVHTGEQAHPVFALVSCRLLDNLTAFLTAGGRKIDAWYAPLSVARVDFGSEEPFRNINTQADLARYESPTGN